MRLPRRGAFVIACVLLPALLPGCGQPVREDRTITWSGDGAGVGFQHGAEGVFVADEDGGPPVKVFQPGPDTLAVSTPLWSPVDRRLLFTTARDPNGTQPPRAHVLHRDDPAGEVHTQRAVVYTCWLRAEPGGEGAPEPVPLFEAECDHVGYVAANLAVRWHPRGDRVLYVKQVAEGLHGLFEYDLDSGESRPAFSHPAEALVFDWTPDGSRLVCVLGSTNGARSDGIWVGNSGEADWWHVPGSGSLAPGELPSLLERLRATRPAWTPDGSRFAFVTFTPGKGGRYSLRLGVPARRAVEVLAEGEQPFRDLHWAPDGSRLGAVRGGETGSLHLLRPGAPLPAPVNRRPVRRFAGWHPSGRHLAYVVPDAIPHAGGELWAFLLPGDPLARDAVLVADGATGGPAREVLSGMRVTFPAWSRREEKLSLWVTFSPTHPLWFARLLGAGLRPGDPAATFDVGSGRLRWMAVNAHEKAQVGHYYLLKRDYAEALRWYEEAGREPPPAARPPEDLFAPRGFAFFHHYCLVKLGRHKEARAKLDEFRREFPNPPDPRASEDARARRLREMLAPEGVFAALLRDLYMAEVFLSLDAGEDGEVFFRRAVKDAGTDAARLSSALVLGQLLLLRKKHTEYAELATGTVAPLLRKLLAPPAAGQKDGLLETPETLGLVGTVGLLPLFVPEFLDGLPRAQLRGLIPVWEALGKAARDDTPRLWADLFLSAAHEQLGQDDEGREAARRVEGNPARQRVLPGGGVVAWVRLLRRGAAELRPGRRSWAER